MTVGEKLIADIAQMGVCVFGDGDLPNRQSEDRRVSADVIKRILHGLPVVETEGAIAPMRLTRFTLCGALIDGDLDLTDASPIHANLPIPVRFENCLFTGQVDLSHSRFGRFSLKGSRLTHFVARSAWFQGAVDFSAIASSELEDDESGCTGCVHEGRRLPRCEFDLQNTRIDGQFRASNARFAVRHRGPDDKMPDGEIDPKALMLAGCRIGGDLMLQPRVEAFGGISISGGEVAGTIWLAGATVTSVWDDRSLNLQLARISGSVSLQGDLLGQVARPFQSTGLVRIYGTHIGGELYMAGAQLAPSADPRFDKQKDSLVIYQARIAQSIRMNAATDQDATKQEIPAWCSGNLTVMNSTVGGMELNGLAAGEGGNFIRLGVWNCEVRGELKFETVNCSELIFGPGSSFGSIAFDQIECLSATAYQVHVLRDLRITNSKISGELNLAESRVGGNLNIGRLVTGELSARQLHVDGSAALNAVEVSGRLDLSSAELSGDLKLEKVDVNLSQRSGIGVLDFSGMRLGGDLRIAQVKSSATLDADGLHVGRGVTIEELSFEDVQWAYSPRLSFRGARVDGRFRIAESSGDKPGIDYVPQILRSAPKDLRTTSLACYPGWQLVELLVVDGSNHGVATLLWNKKADNAVQADLPEVILLDGTSPPIHHLNGLNAKAFVLNAGTVRDYLKFFCAYVWGPDGAFQIVTHEDLLEKILRGVGGEADVTINGVTDEMRSLLKLPLDAKDGNFELSALVAYSNALFKAHFRILPTGMVEMLEDEPLVEECGRLFRFDRPFRRRSLPDWPSGPLIDDRDEKWIEYVTGDAARAAIIQAEQVLRHLVSTATWQGGQLSQFLPPEVNILRLRSLALDFYPKMQICEALVEVGPGEVRIIAWLRDETTKRAVLLSGESNPIHALNALPGELNLDSESKKRGYLEFFTSYVWGPDGAFLIVEKPQDLRSDAKTRERLGKFAAPIERDGDDFIAVVAYAGQLFKARFNISDNGNVEMRDDDPIAGAAFTSNLIFDKPFVSSRGLQLAVPEGVWPIDEAVFRGLWKRLPDGDRKPVVEAYRRECASRFVFDLSGTKVAVLDDIEGKALGDLVRLRLAGFDFEQLDVEPSKEARKAPEEQKWLSTPENGQGGSSVEARAKLESDRREETERQSQKRERAFQERAKWRIEWLERDTVYDPELRKNRPAQNISEFDAHPFERVIDVYRRSGRVNDLVEVIQAKLSREFTLREQAHRSKVLPYAIWTGAGVAIMCVLASGKPLTALWGVALAAAWYYGPTLFNRLFKLCFGYGLQLDRALLTILTCVLVGWPAVEWANRGALRTPELPGITGLPVLVPSIEIYDFGKLSEDWAPQVLVLDQRPVQTHIVSKDGQLESTAVLAGRSTWIAGDTQPAPKEIPCGNEINGFIYAVDVFLPLVDLRQEEQCRPTEAEWASGWRWGKAFFALLGWLVISLTIVTATGLLRRHSEK